MKAHTFLFIAAYLSYAAAIILLFLAVVFLFIQIPEEQYQQQGLNMIKQSVSLGLFAFSVGVFMTGVWTAAFADIVRNTFRMEENLRQQRRPVARERQRQEMDYDF